MNILQASLAVPMLVTPASHHHLFPFDEAVHIDAIVDASVTEYGISYTIDIDLRGSTTFCILEDALSTFQPLAGYVEIVSSTETVPIFAYALQGVQSAETPRAYVVAPTNKIMRINGVMHNSYFEDFSQIHEQHSNLSLRVFIPIVACNAIASGHVFMGYVADSDTSSAYIREHWRYATGVSGPLLNLSD